MTIAGLLFAVSAAGLVMSLGTWQTIEYLWARLFALEPRWYVRGTNDAIGFVWWSYGMRTEKGARSLADYLRQGAERGDVFEAIPAHATPPEHRRGYAP